MKFNIVDERLLLLDGLDELFHSGQQCLINGVVHPRATPLSCDQAFFSKYFQVMRYGGLREVLDVLFNDTGTEFALCRGEQPQNLEPGVVSQSLEQGRELLDGPASQSRARNAATRPLSPCSRTETRPASACRAVTSSEYGQPVPR
jgi:hypothetical protein